MESFSGTGGYSFWGGLTPENTVVFLISIVISEHNKENWKHKSEVVEKESSL